MKKDLDTDKRTAHNSFIKREQKIDKVLINTIDMVGSIQIHSDNAIGTIKGLELEEHIDEN